ncbi:MAG TPA: AbrB/MazE/SpoVT family DNA-binding domain-containing protein [Candidatus Dormibacteraeota bacterium]|nr:AbrB/MazE/SpoVT family DNA-binding domain-containing protein [Candidatus Dormibacteraeota bacterium]
MLTKLREKNQLTLPAEAVRGAHVRPGDYFEVEATDEGILLRPKKVIDAAQAWFWTPEWQAGEREASADIAAGRLKVFDSDDAFLASLDEG